MQSNLTGKLIAERYDQGDLIGSGGLADIFFGWDRKDNRQVAIKRLRPEATDAFHREGLGRQEGVTLLATPHPNILKLYEFGEDHEGIYYITELILGQNLEDLLDHGPMAWKDFIPFAEQCLLALDAVHTNGLIHSDVKPENIMLYFDESKKTTVKLLDFGLAYFKKDLDEKNPQLKQEIIGTPEFVAPEQLKGLPATHLSDIYSIGHVFYHALAGIPACSEEKLETIISMHLEGTFQPLKAIRSDLEDEKCAWVHRFIKRHTDERYQSAEHGLQLLREL